MYGWIHSGLTGIDEMDGMNVMGQNCVGEVIRGGRGGRGCQINQGGTMEERRAVWMSRY